MTSPDEIRLKYAWDWFAHHASQRFMAFNFFVVVVGALTVAYANASSHHSRPLGAAVGLLGVLMAGGFYAIDRRNEQLVGYGRDELAKVETGFAMSIAQSAQAGDHRGITHRTWFRVMILGFGCFSAAATAWAIAGSSLGY